jgi:hypothetical protein
MCEPVKSCGARLVHGGVRLGVGEFGAANIEYSKAPGGEGRVGLLVGPAIKHSSIHRQITPGAALIRSLALILQQSTLKDPFLN